MAKKKKELKEEAQEVLKKEEGVPKRATASPVILKPATEEIKKAAEPVAPLEPPAPPPLAPPQLYSQGELQVLMYAHKLLQQMKTSAGFTVEGTSLKYHDLEFLEKIAVVALQRTQICNQLKQENHELKLQLQVSLKSQLANVLKS